MKTICQHNMFLLAVLGASFLQCGNLCCGTDQPSVSGLDDQVSQAEDLWKAGKPREYYLMVGVILRDITSAYVRNNKNKAAAELFESLLSKTPNTRTDIVGADDLEIMRELASHLVFNRNASVDERRTKVRLLSRYLGRIRKEIVPNYERKIVTQNVCPPVVGKSTVPLMAGMNPKAIDDPVARTAYEAAIRENNENNLMNTRQSVSQKAERQLSKPIIAYMIETFRAEEGSSPLVAECIENAKLTTEEKSEVESKVGPTSGKSDK